MNSTMTAWIQIWTNLKKTAPVVAAMIALLVASLPLFSQSSQGTIQGTILDQSGGVVSGATVTVTDVSRGTSRNLVTDNSGQYVANSLNPSTYTVRAEAKGFQTIERQGVSLEVGQTVRVDLVVQPGQQTQTIVVNEDVIAIDTSDATLGGTISNETINELPLNGRNFEHLLQLRPGVVNPVGTGSGTQSTNGQRTGADLFVIEGLGQIDPSTGSSIINTSYRTGDASSLLPIDAVQEFNAEQYPKAEYGWKAGSVVNVGVKSGTNNLHGTAYAFGRDSEATDAANFFTPGVVTPATLEQFGATAGGRILKDKLFWFVGYEGLRSTLGDSAVNTIPTSVAGLGQDISMVDTCNAIKTGGGTINPLSAQLAGLNAATCVVSPSSPTVENLFPYLPSATSNNYTAGLVSTGPLNNGLIKGDYILNDHNHISGMYFVANADQLVSYDPRQLLPQWEASVPIDIQMFSGAWTWTSNSNWVNDVRMGYAYLFNKTVSADANILPSNPYPKGYSFNTGVTNPIYGGLPEIQIGGFSGYLGAGHHTSARGPEGEADFVDNVSYLRGKHAFRFGFEYMLSVADNDSYNEANGQVKFTSLTNFLEGSPKNGAILLGDPSVKGRQNGFAGFFQDDWRVTTKLTLNLGLRYEYQPPPTEENNYLGNFNPNVNPATTPAVEQVGPGEPIHSLYTGNKRNFSPRFGLAWDVAGNGKTVVRAGASVLYDSIITGEFFNPVPFGANFPSLGINTSGTALNAHSPVTDPLNGSQINWSLAGPVFPGSATTGLTCTSDSPCPTFGVDPNWRTPYVAEWHLDVQRALTNNLTLEVAYVGNHGFKLGAESDVNQPAIGAGWGDPLAGTGSGTSAMGSAAYVCLNDPVTNGPFGNCNVNTAAEVGPFTSKFPYLSQIILLQNRAFSNYNALQVTLNERTSHGLSFLAAFTHSHALDIISDEGISSDLFPVDAKNLRLSYGNSNNDIPNAFSFEATYAIPGKKFAGQMLEGWSISSIVTLQNGLPWSPVDQTNDLTGTGEVNAGGTQTWNYTGPRSAFTSGPQTIPCFGPPCSNPTIPQACFTAAIAPYAGNAPLQQLAMASLTNFGCYMQDGGILTPPAFGTIGNANRNIFRGPNYYNLDFSISKVWKFKERYSAQFRTEFFNFFNHPDFPIPGVNDPSQGDGGQFGCSCTTPDAASSGGGTNSVLGAGGPRHIQFALKLTY
jgi:hypothetical protein